MGIDIQKLKDWIENLSSQVVILLEIENRGELRREYQKWYSQAQLLVSNNLPSMAAEFKNLYYTPGKEKDSTADAYTYFGIRSYLRTIPEDWSQKQESFNRRFRADLDQQRGILLAVPLIIEMRALEVAALVTADLVQGELNEARHLLDHGFIRASGAVAGVALESHLKLLCDQSNLPCLEKDSIVSLSTNLRQNGFISLGDEKQCIAMADTRNKCDHKKKKDPTKGEVEELIDDVDRFTKRVQVF
jgi:hypothetical protein